MMNCCRLANFLFFKQRMEYYVNTRISGHDGPLIQNWMDTIDLKMPPPPSNYPTSLRKKTVLGVAIVLVYCMDPSS